MACQQCKPDVAEVLFGRMRHALLRMLLSMEWSVSSYRWWLRCFLSRTWRHGKSQNLAPWMLRMWKHRVTILAVLTIWFLVLQLFYISDTLSELCFTCAVVYATAFSYKNHSYNSSLSRLAFTMKKETWKLLTFTYLKPVLKKTEEKGIARRFCKRWEGGHRSWYILVQLEELDWFCSLWTS